MVLARIDAAVDVNPLARLDLVAIVVDEVDRRPPHEAAAITVDVGPDAWVRGRRDELARLVRNLLDNAVRHATRAVSVALTVAGDEVVLTVSDDGPGIAPDDRERIFERFSRLDDARSADDG